MGLLFQLSFLASLKAKLDAFFRPHFEVGSDSFCLTGVSCFMSAAQSTDVRKLDSLHPASILLGIFQTLRFDFNACFLLQILCVYLIAFLVC